jgi:ferredoxin
MSVEIRFEPSGLSGMVAEGIYISDAARRMGIPVPRDCAGIGKCTSCQVRVHSGADLLSDPTEVELNVLGEEGLSLQLRLACQVKIDRAGELVVFMTPEQEQMDKGTGDAAEMRKKFGELTLNKKIATLIQLEAVTMFEALNAIFDKPVEVGERLFDRFYSKAKAAQKRE